MSTARIQRFVHDSDTTALSYPARYDDCPSTKFVFALFLNAKTSMLWTVDKAPGTPGKRLVRAYKRMARAGSLTSRPGSSTLSREKRAKLKARSLPNPNPLRPSHDGLATRADRSVYQVSGRPRWLSSSCRLRDNLVSWSRWLDRWLDRWRHRWDNLSSGKSPRDESLREKSSSKNPRHKRRALSGKGWKELKDRISELLPGYRLAGDDTW